MTSPGEILSQSSKMTVTSIETEVTKLTLAPHNKQRAQARILRRTRERLESRLEDLLKFEQLCCKGNDRVCERLGGRHHRANAKCWMYPKICYHCNLIDLYNDKTEYLPRRSNRNLSVKGRVPQLLLAQDIHLEETGATNRRFAEINRMVSPQHSQSLESKWRARALTSCMSVWHAKQESHSEEAIVSQTGSVSRAHRALIADTLAASIEEEDSVDQSPPKMEEDIELESEEKFAHARCYRSQAPSPETRNIHPHELSGQGLSVDVDDKVTQKTVERTRRDPRCEVEFILNQSR